MTPQVLLDAVDALLTGRAAMTWRCWQRACAVLTRIALEQTLDLNWDRQRRTIGMTGASRRTQLLVLPQVAGDEAGETARRAWNGLCHAVHHHTYELAPTAAELRGWHRDVTALLRLLGPQSEIDRSRSEPGRVGLQPAIG
jgi:hypothetical protein